MKKLIGLVGSILIAVMLSGCGAGPAEVAEDFFQHIIEGDYDSAANLVTPETQLEVQMMAFKKGGWFNEEVDLSITQEKISGSVAKVTLTDKISKRDFKVTVLKVEGDWLVKAGR